MKQLSICIVNHKTPELTCACIDSILSTRSDVDLEVLVLNNTNDPMPIPRSSGVDIRVVQNERPAGYGANQNRLFRLATGRYWLALNSDTLVRPKALAELIAFMDTHVECGIAGPRLLWQDGRLQPSGRNFASPWPAFLEVSGLWTRLRESWLSRNVHLCNPHQQVFSPDWLHGPCYIVRPSAVAAVGAFDEAYDMFGEDVDWCWRMRRGGWQILFDPAAEIIHMEGSSPLADRSLRAFKGSMRFIHAHYSRFAFLPSRIAILAALALRWMVARTPADRAISASAFKLVLSDGD